MKILQRKFEKLNCAYKTNLPLFFFFFCLKKKAVIDSSLLFDLFLCSVLTEKSADLHLSSAGSLAACFLNQHHEFSRLV